MDAKYLHAALTLMLCTSVPQIAAAQSVGDLAKTQASTLMLKAQAAEAEARAKLKEAQGSGSATVTAEPDANGAALPALRSINGAGKLYATFLYSTGSVFEAYPGETIPGGHRVAKITANRVELITKSGKRVPLALSDSAPIEPAAVQPSAAQMPIPFPSPMPPASNAPAAR